MIPVEVMASFPPALVTVSVTSYMPGVLYWINGF